MVPWVVVGNRLPDLARPEPSAPARRYDTIGGSSVATGSLLRDGSSRRRAPRCAWMAAALLMVVTLLPGPASAEHWAPPSTVFVPRTGHTTDGLLLDLWR